MSHRLGLVVALVFSALFWGAGASSAGQVNGFSVIPVPATMIYAGQRITGSVLTTRQVPNRYLAVAAVVVDPDVLEGKMARSTLVPGRPIAINQVREPNVIDASKPTRIVFRSGGVTIVGEVVPLASAIAGERIRARNVQTGIVVSGIAQPDGSLLVEEQ